MKAPRWTVLLAVAVMAAILIAVASAASARSTKSEAGPYKIALANSFIGNTWRVEMANLFKGGCKMPPYSKQVTCSVYNSGNDVGKQTQQISNLISQQRRRDRHQRRISDGPERNHQAGLRPWDRRRVVRQCRHGSVRSDREHESAQVRHADGAVPGRSLNGKGNVIMVTGVAGTFADAERNKGAEAVFKANPGIKVVAKYSGNWASADAQRATAAQLPSLPKVDGAWVQGGTDGVLKAFVDAGKPLPITGGEAENGFRRFLLPQGYKGNHVQGMSLGQPPFLSLVALELAREILHEETREVEHRNPVPLRHGQDRQAGSDSVPDPS